MLRKLLLVSALSMLASAGAWSQTYAPVREGDSTVVAAIDLCTRAVYDSVASWVFTFTTANLAGEPGAYGTEAQVGLWRGVPARIIAGGWTPRGKFGAEYYLGAGGELVFVYESSERFAESGGIGWRNFKGLPGWERRIYLVGGRVAYVETTGDGAPPVSAERLQAALRRILSAFGR